MRSFEEILGNLGKEEKENLIENVKKCVNVEALKDVFVQKGIILDDTDVSTVAKVLGLAVKFCIELSDDDLQMVSGGLLS